MRIPFVRLVRQLGWGIASQVASAASNLLLSLTILRSSDASGLGRFTLVFTLYALVLTVSRALCSVPLLLLPHGEEHLHGAKWSATTFGLFFASLLAGFAIVFDSPARALLLIMAAGLPLLLMQDSLRYVHLANGQAQTTATMDMVWFAVQAVATVFLIPMDALSPEGLLFAWLLGGVLSIAVSRTSGRWAGLAPLVSMRTYLQFGRPTFASLAAEQVVVVGIQQAWPFIFAVTLGLAELGVVREAYILIAPTALLISAATPVLATELRRRKAAAQRLPLRKLYVAVAGVAIMPLAFAFVATTFLGGPVAALLGSPAAEPLALLPYAAIWVGGQSAFLIVMLVSRFAVDNAVVLKVRAAGATVELTCLGVVSGLFNAQAALLVAGLALLATACVSLTTFRNRALDRGGLRI